jgi:membrane protease subunit HflK
MQTILDRYKVGIEVVGINLQQGGVRPPEQVQAAFDDVLKAGQERERAKNEAQAYANDVVPRAVGSASRLKEEADAYKARIVAQAQGDAQRFRSVLAEYQKAPQVTRDRMYLDAMQQIYGNVTKVLVDSRRAPTCCTCRWTRSCRARASAADRAMPPCGRPAAPAQPAPVPAPRRLPADPAPATARAPVNAKPARRSRNEQVGFIAFVAAGAAGAGELHACLWWISASLAWCTRWVRSRKSSPSRG